MSDHEKSADWLTLLEPFFAGDLASRAGANLSEGAVIAIHVEGAHFLFQRKNRQNTITVGEGKPDMDFWVPPASLRHLLEKAAAPESGLGSMGVSVIEHLFHSDPAKKISFRVNTGFMGLWAKGYFSVLKAGGPEVASLLGKWGFNSFSRIKEMLHKIRG